MLHEVVGQLASFQVACKLSHTCLNPLAVSTAIQTTSDVTTTNLSAPLQIHMVCLIFTDNHLNSNLKRLYTSVALLNNLGSATLARDLTNPNHMELMCQLIATPDPQLNRSRVWSLASL